MKQCAKKAILITGLGLLFLMLFACNNGLTADAKGGINLKINPSRAMVNGSGYDRYYVECLGPGGAYVALNVKNTSASITDLIGGEWNITVDAFIDDTLEAQGSDSVSVPENGSIDLEIILTRLNPTPTATSTATSTSTPTATAIASSTSIVENINNDYEAEAAENHISCSLRSDVAYSSAMYVDMGGNGSAIEWTSINLNQAGEYTLSIIYDCGEARPVQVYVNNTWVKEIGTVSTGGWGILATESISLNLAESNSIKIINEANHGGVNVDYINIQGAQIIDPSPTIEPTATFTSTSTPTNTYVATPPPTATFTHTPTATVEPDPSNHVENGTFANLDGWVLSGTVVTSSGQIKLGTANSSANYFTSSSLSSGAFYEFKADAKNTSDAGWTGIGFHCLDAAGNQIYSRTFQVNSTTMKSYTSIFEAPQSAVNIEVWIFKGGANGYLYADNVSIKQYSGNVPMPAPPTFGTRVWQETAPGLIVVETESLQNDPANWAKLTADGETFQKFTGGNNTFGGAGTTPLDTITNANNIMEFKVLIPKSGNYYIRISNYHAKEDGDNDVWFWTDMATAEAAQTNWSKFHDHNANMWTWDESGDWINPEGFAGGIYTLRYAGRSSGFKIDRIVIYDKNQYDITVDDSVPGSASESYFSYGSGDPSPTVSPSPTPTFTATATQSGTPDGIAVDGDLADWDNAPDIAINTMISGSGTADEAYYTYLANQSGLYVAVKVLDGTISTANSDKDSIEIYLDGDNIAQGNSSVPAWALPGYGADEYQLIITAGESMIRAFKPGESILLPDGIQGASQLIFGGYAAEAFIPWNVLGLSASGGTNSFSLGFDVGVNDLDSGTTRERQLMWYGTANNWKDAAGFGTLNVSFTTTEDNEAPSQVSNIVVTPEDPFYGDVAVSFNPASDNVGIASYFVELSNGMSKSITGTSCVFENLNGQTNYSVSITASDAAGNSSVNSQSFTTPQKAELEIEPPPARVAVGSNFWNIGWGHKWEDYFKSGINWGTAYANDVNVWHPQLLKDIADAKYPALRFMDWIPTNSNSTMVSWADRQKPNVNHYSSDGVAIEWMIDLCNRTDTNLWINMPHRTFEDWQANPNDNFWTKAAALIRDNLKPSLKVYVEYSNETFGFGQRYFVKSWGSTMGFDPNEYTAGNYFTVYASVRMWKAFKDTFGADAGRVQAVMAGQMGSKSEDNGVEYNYALKCHILALTNTALNYGFEAACADINHWGIMPDYYAITSYIGGAGGGAVSNVVEQFKADVDETVRWAQIVQNQIFDAGMNWKLCAYEGGHHYKTNADAFAANSKSYECYKYWLQECSGVYYFIMHYTHTSTWKSSNAWGAKENINQPLSQAHRFRAILDWNNGN